MVDHPSHSPIGAFLQRLLRRSQLTADEQRAVLRLTGTQYRYAAHRDIVAPGEEVESACLVARGLVARYDQMLDGRRQVTAFYVPGDMADLHSVVSPKARWSITAISPATIVRIPHHQLRDLCAKFPAISLAFWRDGTADASIFAKWVGNLGRKDAKQRIAHLFCELGMRMEAAGLGTRSSFQLAATQEQLGEATGLTAVHVNRTLQEIRAAGLLSFRHGSVEIADWPALASLGEFDPAFLLLDGPERRILPTVNGGERVSAL
jgi:CRP-like cAMP-binding protein